MPDLNFVLAGSDNKLLTKVKIFMEYVGYIYDGYVKNILKLPDILKSKKPDIAIIHDSEFDNNCWIYSEIDKSFETACIFITNEPDETQLNFSQNSILFSHLSEPLYPDIMKVAVYNAILNKNRAIKYQKKIKELESRLDSRKLIEKAKWLLVEKENMTEPAALEHIRKRSRNKGISMSSVAQAIIIAYGIDSMSDH